MQISGELEGLSALTHGETEQLLFTLQSSLQIRRRYQFYIWAQSRLNAMVPHDVLICAHHDPAQRALSYDCFPMFPIAREALDRLYQPGSGMMARVLECWNDTERMPCTGEAGEGRVDPMAATLDASGIRGFVAHGMPSPHDPRGVETFFCFAQAGSALVPAHIKSDARALTARHSFMLELLLPYLHATYQRVVMAERPREAARSETPTTDMVITEREVEILCWVREGMSNQEIGTQLAISPLTVKNHVQKILRKLGASNRAQAVSKAISLGLIANTVTGG